MSREVRWLLGLPGIDNVGLVRWNVFCSGQPTLPRGIETCVGIGIKRVVNLRRDNEEAPYWKAHGIEYIHHPIIPGDPIDPEYLTSIAEDIMRDRVSCLFHCMAGMDRTGAVRYAIRVLYDGWSHNEAMEEMRRYIWYENDVYDAVHKAVISFNQYVKAKDLKEKYARRS